MTTEECYQILDISPQASQEEIKAAYLKLIRKWHPDINKDPNAIEMTKKINEAHETLTKQSINPLKAFPEDLFRDTFFGRGAPFKGNPFASFDFDFNSKITKSSVVLEIDESNSKNLDLIPEILRKAGFIIKRFTVTKYH